jgi:hypothetical protein
MKPAVASVFLLSLLTLFLLSGCIKTSGADASQNHSRYEKIPPSSVKMNPENDPSPPVLHAEGWEKPVPVAGQINTAGAEDSPFITPDGNTMYLFFTPDVTVPVEKQILDNVTGIYVSQRQGGSWSEPKRVWLQDPGTLALDGCEFVQGGIMWFCSAREGYAGIHWFTAEYVDGKWLGWKNSDFDPGFKTGELHFSRDGDRLFFHSDRPGGKGGLDIWMSKKEGGIWKEPTDVEAVNTADDEGWPFLSQDGKELWFTRFYQGSPAIFRSQWAGQAWSDPELIISQFAGEPSLDDAGDIYFVHHYYKEGKMVEADVYVAKKTSG